jgi:hypothetical protein
LYVSTRTVVIYGVLYLKIFPFFNPDPFNHTQYQQFLIISNIFCSGINKKYPAEVPEKTLQGLFYEIFHLCFVLKRKEKNLKFILNYFK